MRTTVEIAEPLLKRVRGLMKKRKVTLRTLVEEGLQRVLEEDAPKQGFQLRDASFKGETGFASGVSAEDLPDIIRKFNEESVRR